MGLTDSQIHGIVTVMGDDAHNDRIENMGSALARLAAARERRGPVGIIDPADAEAFDEVGRSDATYSAMPRASRRRGLFRFGDRARAIADTGR